MGSRWGELMVYSQLVCFLATRFLFFLLGMLLVCAVQTGVAAPAHFWISDNGITTAGPGTFANIAIVKGAVGTLHIWGRPETGKKLRNISLNLVAQQAGINFVDSSITMHNNAGNGRQRYEYTSDSASIPALESEETLSNVKVHSQADAINLLQGYSLSAASASIQGFGDQCVGGELGCVLAGDGQPAWLIASVEYDAVTSGFETQIFLQIGEHGMNHESLVPGDYDRNGIVDEDDLAEIEAQFSSKINLWPDGSGNGRVDAADQTIWRDNQGSVSVFESALLTSVRFGTDTSDGVAEPIYNAATNRDTTLAMDDPDAIIKVTSSLAAPLIVPEPTSLGLLLWISILGVGSSRRCDSRSRRRCGL